MPQFGKSSLQKLATLDPRLQKVLNKAIQNGPDMTIIYGHRTKEEQDKEFNSGNSKLQWPNSKHNSSPSLAVDIAQWDSKLNGINWEDLKSFHVLAGYILGIGAEMGIKLRWGGDWNRNFSYTDQTFHDLPHIEVVD